MMFRHWRIAFSVIFLSLLAATLVMWWQSYTWVDSCYGRSPNEVACAFISYKGAICFAIFSGAGIPTTLDCRSEKINSYMQKAMGGDHPVRSFLGFSDYVDPRSWGLGVPYWFISILFVLLGGLPWYWQRFNFSLRTFFIAFTVLAVVLGFIGWLIR